jgi:hypothetical protein
VAVFLTTTVAPERTAPVASDTVPESVAVVPWPKAKKLLVIIKLAMARSLIRDRLIQNLLPRVVLGWLFIDGVASLLFTVWPIGARQALKVRL